MIRFSGQALSRDLDACVNAIADRLASNCPCHARNRTIRTMILQAGRWKSTAMVNRYGERLLARRSGAAQLARLQERE